MSKQEEFERLIREKRRLYIYLAMQFVVNMEDAEDVVQDSLMQAYTHLEAFDGTEATMSTWIAAIIRNASFNVLRARKAKKRANAIQLDDTIVAYVLSDQPGVDEVFEQKRKLDKALEAIETLPRKTKAAFKLCVVKGDSYKEAASELHISEGAIKSAVCRGRNIVVQACG